MVVDKAQLGVIGLKGIQELIVENNQLKTRVTTLEQELQSLKDWATLQGWSG
jgi:hypothetical protein